MTIHTINKHKLISANIQATWVLISVREEMWEGMEAFGMERQTKNKAFLLSA